MARDFDGVNDVVSRDNADISQPDQDFTLTIWAFADSEGGDAFGTHYIVTEVGATAFIKFSYSDTGTNQPKITLRMGSTVELFGANDDAPLSVWDHWAVRFRTSDNLLELIKNGVMLTSTTTDPGTTTIGQVLVVGAQSTSGFRAFDGRLADFRWWNSVRLSLDEIDMVRRGAIVRPDALTVWWPLWGTTDPEPDWSGANRHGTVSGAVRIDHPPGISAAWLAPQSRRVQRIAAGGPAPIALDNDGVLWETAPSAPVVQVMG